MGGLLLERVGELSLLLPPLWLRMKKRVGGGPRVLLSLPPPSPSLAAAQEVAGQGWVGGARFLPLPSPPCRLLPRRRLRPPPPPPLPALEGGWEELR